MEEFSAWGHRPSVKNSKLLFPTQFTYPTSLVAPARCTKLRHLPPLPAPLEEFKFTARRYA